MTNRSFIYRRLDVSHIPAFAELIPSSKLIWLNRLDQEPIKGIGAFDGDSPVGIVFADILLGGKLAEVRYLWVDPAHRDVGIGTNLMREIEGVLQETHCSGMLFHYRPNTDNADALQRIFQKLDWAEPQLLLRTFKTDKRMTTLPWLDFEIDLPDDTEIFPWRELTEQELQELRAKFASAREVNSVYVSPFFDEDRIEPLNSLGLRYKGEVVGWLITHRLDPHTIRYNSIFITESLRGLSGAAIALLIQSIKLHAPHNEIPYAVFAVRNENRSMQSIINRYLAPHAISTAELWHSWKPKELIFL